MRKQVQDCAPCKLKGKKMNVVVPPPAPRKANPVFQQRVQLGNRPKPQTVKPQRQPQVRAQQRHKVQAAIIPVVTSFSGGNPICLLGASSRRISAPKNGTYELCANLSITITGDAKTCNWTATNTGIKSIAVKGGTLVNTYTYLSSLTGDTGLVSPLNNGGQVPDISHIDICFTCPSGDSCGPNGKPDCAGVCNGPSVKDCAGTCYDPSKSSPPHLLDCAGTCYKAGSAPPHLLDCAGTCYESGQTPPNVPDCAGTCFKSGTTPPHSPDCEGVCGGTKVIDCKGVCGGSTVQDCKGVCGGSSYQDCTGTCVTPCTPSVQSSMFARTQSKIPRVTMFAPRRR